MFDAAANAYTQPFFMHNDALALRAFEDNVNASSENNISVHPDQFTLFCIGSFDDQNGALNPCDPRSLGNGIEYKKENKNDSQLTNKLDEILIKINDLK